MAVAAYDGLAVSPGASGRFRQIDDSIGCSLLGKWIESSFKRPNLKPFGTKRSKSYTRIIQRHPKARRGSKSPVQDSHCLVPRKVAWRIQLTDLQASSRCAACTPLTRVFHAFKAMCKALLQWKNTVAQAAETCFWTRSPCLRISPENGAQPACLQTCTI